MLKRCYVDWCSNGSDSRNRDNKFKNTTNNTLFTAPKDPELRMKWHRAIGRKDKILSPHDTVCELHFDESDMIRFYETVMPDGTVHRSCELKPGAIPTMNKNKERLTPEVVIINEDDVVPCTEILHGIETRSVVINQIDTDSDTDIDIKDEIIEPEGFATSDHSTVTNNMETEDLLTMEHLKNDLRKSCLPERWAFLFDKGDIHFPHFNSKLVNDMVVTVKGGTPLSGEVSVPDGVKRETDILNFTSFGNFIRSLTLIEKQKLCIGSGPKTKRDSLCPIFMRHSTKSPISLRSIRCPPCKALRKKELSSDHRREKSQKIRTLRYERTLTEIRKQNVQLSEEVAQLKSALIIAKKMVPMSMRDSLDTEYLYCESPKASEDFIIPDNLSETSSTS